MMKPWTGLIVAAVLLAGGYTAYHSYGKPREIRPALEEIVTQAQLDQVKTQPAPTTSTATKKYSGSWFDVSYPADFVPLQVGQDEATFTSPDNSVQFFVFSPQWSGNPESYLNVLPTETRESESSSASFTDMTNQYGPLYYKKIITYVTLSANDGSYKRSYMSLAAGYVSEKDSNDLSSATHMVFGIKYKDAAGYKAYLDRYLAFKKSLIQYAD